MGISRYAFSKRSNGAVAPSKASFVIGRAIKSGSLKFTIQVIKEGQRLDHIAASAYGDASLWWLIAAASGIGWGMQVPPGVVVKIPTEVSTALALLI